MSKPTNPRSVLVTGGTHDMLLPLMTEDQFTRTLNTVRARTGTVTENADSSNARGPLPASLPPSAEDNSNATLTLEYLDGPRHPGDRRAHGPSRHQDGR